MQDQRGNSGTGFVRAGAIQHHLAITRDLMLPVFYPVHQQVSRAGNEKWITVYGRFRAHIDNHYLLARFLSLPKFLRRNPG